MDHFSSSHSSPRSRQAQAPFYHPSAATARPRVAVSACLAGERVRYDGASRYLPALCWLEQRLHLISVCPEVGAGLGVPRPPVQLVAVSAGSPPLALGRDDQALDVTAALAGFARSSLAALSAAGPLCGYLLKSRSPSCGLGSTPLFDADRIETGITSGIQAAHFQDRLPWLSFCEETDLVDAASAQAFELRCRLVFDWLHAGDATLHQLLRHYRTVFEKLRVETPAIAPHDTDKTASLAALQRGCSQLPAPRLLEIFSG